MKLILIPLLFSTLLMSDMAMADDLSMSVGDMLSDKDVMQAANACLLKHPKGGNVFVENVYPMNHGMVGIVTADASGRRYDCNAELGTGKVRSSEPIIEPKGPLFVSARQMQAPPQGECFSSSPLVIGRQLQGWLLSQTGKCGGVSWNGIAAGAKTP
ncbi:hypothetical protein [Collimonas sp. OK412]|jgi:hypothetical protein|uniref:hypothetical protein n=1 Tax=Collimonas sp. (strain OK412) TaxID=1801619 RepID=UPI0008EDB0C9|nr:hypothetical protein [Collimonas sp. OK412]SFD11270.1 hypothetical protein SAMN04515619_12365 [Collimonas sp. OK412]